MITRLFWKLLIVSWITMALTTASVIVLRIEAFTKYTEVSSGSALQAERERAAAVVLQYGGEPALEEVTSLWPADVRKRLQLTGTAGEKTRVTFQTLPANTVYLHLPPLVAFLVGWLFFSVALAWYLSRPVSLLRNGLRNLSQGKMETRIASGMGNRREELTDLAHEFDVMAERLQSLIASRDRLLHDVSHELRSPLGRLTLAVSLARMSGELSGQTANR